MWGTCNFRVFHDNVSFIEKFSPLENKPEMALLMKWKQYRENYPLLKIPPSENNHIKITFTNSKLIHLLLSLMYLGREKGRDLTRSCAKSPIPTGKSKTQRNSTKTSPKTSITQRLWTHLGYIYFYRGECGGLAPREKQNSPKTVQEYCF